MSRRSLDSIRTDELKVLDVLEQHANAIPRNPIYDPAITALPIL